MARDHLFTALRKFQPIGERDALENFVTEAFALLLRRHQGLGDASDTQGWDFADTGNHRWHPLHLRRPALEVFRGTTAFEDQVARFVEHGREAIGVLLAGGELEELHARLTSETAAAT